MSRGGCDLRLWAWLMGLLLAAGVYLFATGGISLTSSGIGGESNPGGLSAEGAVVGQPAPDFTLTTLTGRQISLSQFRGRKPVFVNFWTTWCTYCKREVPDLEALHRHYGPRLEVLGVDLTAEEVHPGAVATMAKKLGVTYPVLLDTTGQVADTYLVHGIPTSVVINRSGVVTSVIQGDADTQEMRSAIRGALGGA